LNLAAARSLASVAAFFVKAKKAMSVGCIPDSNAVSTMFKSVVVFPVPGGPNILNIVFNLFNYLTDALSRHPITSAYRG
jgi:hypothetical protein